MTRVNPNTSPPSTAWQEDTWYAASLAGWEIEAKGTPGYKDQPRKHARMELHWAVSGIEDELWDWLDLTVRPQKDGTQSKCKLLICAVAGRDPRTEATPWVDDETAEFGFGADTENDPPAGRIITGTRVAIKGEYATGKDGVERFGVTKYGPVHLAQGQVSPQQVPGPTALLSADGRWMWNGTAWVPAQQPAAAAPVPAAQQQELI